MFLFNFSLIVFLFLDEEREKKIRVEIKPISNGAGPISASVDELRATVENFSLSPLGVTLVCLILIE